MSKHRHTGRGVHSKDRRDEPAMPLPASSTMLNGRMTDGSMNAFT
jgi:hypothetical protein